MIEEDFITYLLSQSTITNIVDQKVFYNNRGRWDDLPWIEIIKTGESPTYSHNGYSSLNQINLQLTAWAKTDLTSRELLLELRKLLHGFSGTMNGRNVYDVFITNSIDQRDPDTNYYHNHIEIQLKYEGN
jgi:hypothetical protein